MTVEGERFDWWSMESSKYCGRGSCVGAAPTAAGGSPTIRPFALPGKQFVKQVVLEESKAYLGSDVSYEKSLQRRGPALLYDDRADLDCDGDVDQSDLGILLSAYGEEC